MAKQTEEALPTMDEFTEDSLLETMEEDTASTETSEEEEQEEEQEEKPVKKAEDEQEKEEEQEEEEKKPEAKKKPEKKESKKEDEEEEESDEELAEANKFFEEVESMTGVEVEVEYPEGVDPLGPEGIAIREKALVENVMADQLAYLKQNFPRSFKMLEHEAAGGSVEDLLKTSAGVDYSKIELKEDNPEQAKKILMDYYTKDKGLSEKKAQLAVEDDEDSEGGVYDAAKKILESKIKAQKESEERVIKEQKEKSRRQKQQDLAFTGVVRQFTEGGKVGKFEIPKGERDEFFAYALSNIHRVPDGNGYMVAIPLAQNNLEEALQQLYFGFKGGDLNAVVERRATTESAKRLRVRAKKESQRIKQKEEEQRETKKTLPTMDEYTT